MPGDISGEFGLAPLGKHSVEPVLVDATLAVGASAHDAAPGPCRPVALADCCVTVRGSRTSRGPCSMSEVGIRVDEPRVGAIKSSRRSTAEFEHGSPTDRQREIPNDPPFPAVRSSSPGRGAAAVSTRTAIPSRRSSATAGLAIERRAACSRSGAAQSQLAGVPVLVRPFRAESGGSRVATWGGLRGQPCRDAAV